MILEEDGRLAIRLAPVAPAADDSRPWSAPAAVRLGLRFEPARAATMRETELADTVLIGFRRAIEALGRPAPSAEVADR
jgi:hypothetical protein